MGAVEQAERRVAYAEDARLEADRKVAEARAALTVATRTLEAWRAYHGVSDQERGDGKWVIAPMVIAHGAVPSGLGTAASPTGRQSMRDLMAEHDPATEWTIPVIAGFLELDESAHDAIGQSLARMARDGEIFRPRRGVYKLRPPELPGSDQGTEKAQSGADSQDGPG